MIRYLWWYERDLCQIFWTHWTMMLHFFGQQEMTNSHWTKTHFISSSFVKMRWIPILKMCRSSANFWMDEWQYSSITADTALMLTYITTVLSLPPICSISVDSLSSVITLFYLRVVEWSKISFWKASFDKIIVSIFDFCYSFKTSIFWLMWQNTVCKHILFPRDLFSYTSHASKCWMHLLFIIHFFSYFSFSWGVCTTVFINPAVTRDLYGIQTSADACWRDKEWQNTRASSECR